MMIIMTTVNFRIEPILVFQLGLFVVISNYAGLVKFSMV